MSKWIEKKLSDVADIIGGGTPSTKNNEYYGGDIAWLTPKDLSGYNYKRISKGERNITKLGLEKSSAKILPKDTVLFTSRAPIGYVAIASNEVTTNQGFKSLILKNGNDPDFFYYLLKHNVPLIEARASGSTFKEVSGQVLKDTMLSIPNVDTQIQIAKVLSSLDDKIENNRRMNEVLEGMAQAIFKSWFVDFDPVHAKVEALKNGGSEDDARIAAMCAISGKTADALAQLKSENPDDFAQLATTADAFPSAFTTSELGSIPKGWEERSIYEISDVIYGAPFKSKLFNTNKDGLPLVRIRDLKNEAPGVFTPENHVKGYLIQNGDLVVGMDGEFRPYIWGGNPAWMNQRICRFKPKPEFSEGLIKGFISSQLDHYEKTATATTVIHLGKGDIDRFTYLKPNSNLLEKYCEISKPIFEQIVLNKVSAKSLAETRDALLPKLLSGEIDVTTIGQ